MTDEEMTEESLISYRKEPKWAGKMFMQDENTCYKDGFLAGLKAGRLKWHILRNNPNDLPKEFDLIRKAFGIYPEEKECHVVMNQDGEFVYCVRNIDNKQKAWYWAYADETLGVALEPIAWCEIPKYTEE